MKRLFDMWKAFFHRPDAVQFDDAPAAAVHAASAGFSAKAEVAHSVIDDLLKENLRILNERAMHVPRD